jgi:hypothetical protein
VRIERTRGPRRLWGLLPRRGDELRVTLALRSPADLFTPPTADPFSEEFETYGDKPALDAIVAEMEAGRIPSHVRTSVELPAEEIDPSLEQRMRDAVARYCRVKLGALDVELRRTTQLGLRTLVVGFLAVIALNAASRQLDNSSNDFILAISQGLSIVSWVTLWFPVNLLLYDRWYYRRDQTVYRTLLAMEITVRASR